MFCIAARWTSANAEIFWKIRLRKAARGLGSGRRGDPGRRPSCVRGGPDRKRPAATTDHYKRRCPDPHPEPSNLGSPREPGRDRRRPTRRDRSPASRQTQLPPPSTPAPSPAVSHRFQRTVRHPAQSTRRISSRRRRALLESVANGAAQSSFRDAWGHGDSSSQSWTLCLERTICDPAELAGHAIDEATRNCQ